VWCGGVAAPNDEPAKRQGGNAKRNWYLDKA
jgi:hypothetical protein